MKKISMAFFLLALSKLTMAQDLKPIKGTITSQVGISLSTLQDNINSMGLNGRYFIKDKLAFRFAYQVLNSKSKENFAENTDGTGTMGSYSEKISNHALFLGLEKHFKGTKRLSPFIGVELGVGFGKLKGTGDNADETGFVNDFQLDKVQKFTGLAFNAFLGFDYWITDGLYAGIEFAPLSKTLSFVGETSRTETQSNFTQKVIDPKSYYSEFSSINAVPFFRLGWRFN